MGEMAESMEVPKVKGGATKRCLLTSAPLGSRQLW